MTNFLLVTSLFLLEIITVLGDQPLSVVSVGLPESGRIAAFGDINSDKHSDIFIINVQNSTYQLQIYLNDGNSYGLLESAVITESLPIDNVIPGDFDHDGKLDVLISGPGFLPDSTRLNIYLGNFYSFTSGPIELPLAMDEVLMMDFNNDQWPDLFGELYPGGQRVFWVNQAQRGANFNFTIVYQNVSTPLSSPQSSAFVDLDGDCLADLFVTSVDPVSGATQFEIWLNEKLNGFILHSIMVARLGTGQVTFMDFDGDGALDFIFPVCYPPTTCTIENTLHVVYNQQLPMCSSIWSPGSGCREQDNLCSADPNFKFGNTSSAVNDPLHTVIPASAFSGCTYVVGPQYGPITIRAGDSNLDGFPDLLIGLRATTTPSKTFVSLWSNEPCSSNEGTLCDPQAVNAGRRTFQRSTDGTSELENVDDAYSGAWLDIGDLGKVDVLVLQWAPLQYSGTALVNNFNGDALFLTTLVSNGVCDAWCPSNWPAQFPDPKPYGVNYPGATIKFTVTDMSGNKQAKIGAQLGQSAYSSLQTPYNLYGLGRTSNYIEEFYAGVPLNYPNHWYMWVAMIPNSQLIVFPWPPNSPIDWTLELFISPSSRILMVCIALASTLVGLAGVIGYFHLKERKEDEAEKKQSEHLFAF